jgi:hypothetical protein
MMRNILLACVAISVVGCSKEEAKPGPDAAASAAPSAVASATPSAPAPSASAGPPVDCPKGSSGEGSFYKPCDAKGAARMMTATWNGKTDDKGPFFKITNKSPATILYGKIAVYFYDKSGKQVPAKDGSRYHGCGGNIFEGVMKPSETAVIQFSCVTKANIPDGVTSLEAEMQMVGFVDPANDKKVAYYWRNNDLCPDDRKKGGVK